MSFTREIGDFFLVHQPPLLNHDLSFDYIVALILSRNNSFYLNSGFDESFLSSAADNTSNAGIKVYLCESSC